MGFEVQFKYHEKKEEGGYNTEEVKTLKKTIGKQTDEVGLEDVAKVVFGQLARRDIWVVDAEIFEFTKKKVSFRENKDGIVIKNRKFSFDIGGALQYQDLAPEPGQLQPHEIQQIQQGGGTQMKALVPMTKPVRFEIYDPHPDVARIAAAKKLPFTLGKRYPIFEEKPDSRGMLFGMIYVTEDDQGNRRSLNDKHFVPEVNLTNNFGGDSTPNHIEKRPVLVGEGGQEAIAVNGKQMTMPDIYTLGRKR